MAEDRGWAAIETAVGLLTCAIPLELKGQLWRLLAALARDEGAAVSVWNCMLQEQICVELPNGKLAGIQVSPVLVESNYFGKVNK
jgi:hypothetical protein